MSESSDRAQSQLSQQCQIAAADLQRRLTLILSDVGNSGSATRTREAVGSRARECTDDMALAVRSIADVRDAPSLMAARVRMDQYRESYATLYRTVASLARTRADVTRPAETDDLTTAIEQVLDPLEVAATKGWLEKYSSYRPGPPITLKPDLNIRGWPFVREISSKLSNFEDSVTEAEGVFGQVYGTSENSADRETARASIIRSAKRLNRAETLFFDRATSATSSLPSRVSTAW